tara:strand:+ start:327 stop:500 length:174 start_codon:yes stop_codon:yes gene_type:complete
MEEKTEVKKKKKVAKVIKPLKDFNCKFENQVYNMKKGEEIEVPSRLLVNLTTEKVIK